MKEEEKVDFGQLQHLAYMLSLSYDHTAENNEIKRKNDLRKKRDERDIKLFELYKKLGSVRKVATVTEYSYTTVQRAVTKLRDKTL